METLFRFISPPHPCSYLPRETATQETVFVAGLTAAEYQRFLLAGWRRFGGMLFRPVCKSCQACQSLRVDVDRFRPTRSQQRSWRLNYSNVARKMGRPKVSRAKLDLYDRFHAFGAEHKGWPDHPPKDAASYRESFVDNPPFTEEWCYYLDHELVGVGYVDAVPAGLSAIYFVYEPELRHRGLGVYNVLSLIDEARARVLPHVYLGYFVAGCPSLEYKANYRPNQILHADGKWRGFRE